MSDLRDSKYQMAEYRISIYGRCVAARRRRFQRLRSRLMHSHQLLS